MGGEESGGRGQGGQGAGRVGEGGQEAGQVEEGGGEVVLELLPGQLGAGAGA